MAKDKKRETPVGVLQDQRFGEWLKEHVDLERDLFLFEDFDIRGEWPFRGSILDALSVFSDGPTDLGANGAARVLSLGALFAEHLAVSSSVPGHTVRFRRPFVGRGEAFTRELQALTERYEVSLSIHNAPLVPKHKGITYEWQPIEGAEMGTVTRREPKDGAK
jgi:hypothetical protein